MYLTICVYADTTIHHAVTSAIGQKVTFNCTSPREHPTSVIWRYQPSNNSNASSVLIRIEEDRSSLLDTSGRLSLNRTVKNSYHLVIYATQQRDSGTYTCSVDEEQHVTVLNVKGMILHCSFRRKECIVAYLCVCVVL